MEGFRFMISNRVALSFFMYQRCDMLTIPLKQGVTARHIYAVITYLLILSIRLDDAPRLVETPIEAEGY